MARLATTSTCGGVTPKTDLRTVHADLAGDGRVDTALLLENQKGGFAVWVWLAEQRPPILAIAFEAEHRPSIGITVAMVSRLPRRERSTVSPGSAAIDLMFCERSSEILYRDSKAGRFRSLLMTD